MSVVSTATIRSTNPKECKDKRNRERLLAGPVGSDFSLPGQDVDLEMDYYDYNVVNAGAAPGSYLGMDPAFLVWIPPLDESGEILEELDRNYHEMQDIRPKQHVDPGSNTESPEEEMLLPKTRMTADENKLTFIQRRSSNEDDNKASDESIDREKLPLVDNDEAVKVVAVQLHEYPKLKSFNVQLENEKETMVEKSPSMDSNKMEDIKFADEEDDEQEYRTDDQCNIEIAYQDSNVISSS